MPTTPATSPRRSSSLRIALLGALAAVLTVGPAPASGNQAVEEYRLNPDQAKFWPGEHILQANVPDPALCNTTGTPATRCPEYKIRVLKNGAWRLRVALRSLLPNQDAVRVWPDFPSYASEMIFDIQVLREGVKEPVAKGTTYPGAHAVEVFVVGPLKGVYTVRVIPESVSNMTFEMRAKLEASQPPKPADPEAFLLPNLRVIPPFEFNFFRPTVTYGPGSGKPDPANSCLADETEEAIAEGFDPPTVCLRYSMGLENAGDGRWDLTGVWRGAADPTGWDVYQRLWRADGTGQPAETDEEKRLLHPAGEARYDPEHAHDHYEHAWEFTLFRVRTDGSLEKIGPGRKLGVQTVPERMAEWRRFWPACGGDNPGRGCQHDRDAEGTGGQLTGAFRLQAGWGDNYEWNRGGNYVDFPHDVNRVPKHGRYLLRGEADPATLDNPTGMTIESNETDNFSYALVEVFADGRVDLIERGYGQGPWDPAKRVLKETP